MPTNPGSQSGPGNIFDEMKGLRDWIKVIRDIIDKQPDQRLMNDVSWSPNGVIDNLTKVGDCRVVVPPQGGPVTTKDLVRILDALHKVCTAAVKHMGTLEGILDAQDKVGDDANNWRTQIISS